MSRHFHYHKELKIRRILSPVKNLYYISLIQSRNLLLYNLHLGYTFLDKKIVTLRGGGRPGRVSSTQRARRYTSGPVYY